MHTTARERLAHVLAGDSVAASDVAMLRLPGDALSVQVVGVGPVTLPVRAAQAKRLISVARPAMFGRGEQTLSDSAVRDTWELTPDQVTVDGADWDASLAAALGHFRDELGLPAGSVLRAALHSMLVYTPGQFFLPHQDSEKHDDMVATLVVALPSVHSGGELVVDDGGTERTFRGSPDDLVLAAFYADRRHEVRPVWSGYRVTLTFNLMVTAAPPSYDVGQVGEAARHLTEHFTSRVTSRYGDRDLGEPTRLAFLLDHEYTQAGLTSRRFKGADADRVAVLRAAAEQAGCEVVFALAEIKETWDVLPDPPTWRYGREENGWDDGPVDGSDDNVDINDHDLTKPTDGETTLGWWVAADGSGAETINLPLPEYEVCAVTPSRSLTPYRSEYEGYMGNDGNTADRWYRRAAVVVWPKEKSFASRAEAGSSWALTALRARLHSGDLAGARADVTSLAPVWRRAEARDLAAALDVAAAWRDPLAANVVLAPFRLEMLTADHAPLVAAVATEYGDQWMTGLIDTWESAQRFPREVQTTWAINDVLPLSQALHDIGAAPLADHLGDPVWRSPSDLIDIATRLDDPTLRRSRLAELGLPLARLLEAVSDEFGSRITTTMKAQDDNVTDLLVATLLAHRPPARAAFPVIAQQVSQRLTRLLGFPPRAVDDWSIDWSGCGCEHCLHLETFLASKSERRHEWRLAKPGRQHVHRLIDASGLPVRHTTRRQGSPFTLVLEKTQALFQQDEYTRRQAQRDLDWVAAHFG